MIKLIENEYEQDDKIMYPDEFNRFYQSFWKKWPHKNINFYVVKNGRIIKKGDMFYREVTDIELNMSAFNGTIDEFEERLAIYNQALEEAKKFKEKIIGKYLEV